DGYQERLIYERAIDELVLGKNYPQDFITTLKLFEIMFFSASLMRAKNLYDELRKYGLQLKHTSKRCRDYIIGNNNAVSLQKTVDTMREMNWFFHHTDYPSRMDIDQEASDRYEQSETIK